MQWDPPQISPAPHAFPQAPQWDESIWVATQALPHKVQPGLQAHCPPEHEPYSVGHTVPHAPQLVQSLPVSTQLPWHDVVPGKQVP
jgi:hypothetical protein